MRKKILTTLIFTTLLCCQTSANAAYCASAQTKDPKSSNGWKYDQSCFGNNWKASHRGLSQKQ
jgi:hypothetical protein